MHTMLIVNRDGRSLFWMNHAHASLLLPKMNIIYSVYCKPSQCLYTWCTTTNRHAIRSSSSFSWEPFANKTTLTKSFHLARIHQMKFFQDLHFICCLMINPGYFLVLLQFLTHTHKLVPNWIVSFKLFHNFKKNSNIAIVSKSIKMYRSNGFIVIEIAPVIDCLKNHVIFMYRVVNAMVHQLSTNQNF